LKSTCAITWSGVAAGLARCDDPGRVNSPSA
jgi:hypothetical protein